MLQSTRADWTVNRMYALILGIVLVLIGVIGFFIPQENSTGVQALFGIFDVDVVHNLVHIVSGLIGIGAAFGGFSVTFNRVFGIIYTLIAILGLMPFLYFPTYGNDSGRFLGLMHLSVADHVLHFIIGLSALAVGYYADRNMRRPAAL